MKKYISHIGILAVGLILGYFLFGGNGASNEDNDHQHTSKSEVWTCSMHPQVRQPEPGDCPLCGMDLIPLEETNEDENPVAIKMSATAMKLADVQTSVVSTQALEKTIRVSGKLQPDERKVFSQTTHISGRIEKLMVNFTGERVNKGQILAYIYSPDLVTAQRELFEANKIKDSQPALYKAAVEKLKNWKLTESQITGIIEKGTVQEQFPILADYSGVVLNQKVKLGDHIMIGQSLYEIANLNSLWALFDIYESDLSWVKLGNSVKFSVNSLSEETFEGKVSFISPVIDPAKRTASARVQIANSKGLLKPEMLIQGKIESKINHTGESIIVPKSAVLWTGNRSVVYLKVGEAQFAMQEVTLGAELADGYAVKKGLKAGDEVVTNGAFSIDAAAQLAGKPSMMNRPKTIELDENARKLLQPLLQDYLALKNALVADDFPRSISQIKSIRGKIETIKKESFASDEIQELWSDHQLKLNKSLQESSSAQNIQSIRDEFKDLSEQMIAIFKATGSLEQTLYIEYCPMANSDQGAYWLSADSEIRNPYFGASMLKCGEVKGEIR